MACPPLCQHFGAPSRPQRGRTRSQASGLSGQPSSTPLGEASGAQVAEALTRCAGLGVVTDPLSQQQNHLSRGCISAPRDVSAGHRGMGKGTCIHTSATHGGPSLR